MEIEPTYEQLHRQNWDSKNDDLWAVVVAQAKRLDALDAQLEVALAELEALRLRNG